MKLIELLEVIGECENVAVFRNGEKISYYDGKNSIDENLNYSDVIRVATINNDICIAIA